MKTSCVDTQPEDINDPDDDLCYLITSMGLVIQMLRRVEQRHVCPVYIYMRDDKHLNARIPFQSTQSYTKLEEPSYPKYVATQLLASSDPS